MNFSTCEHVPAARLQEVRGLRKWLAVSTAIFLPLNTLNFVRPMHGVTGIVIAALAGIGFFAMISLGFTILMRTSDEFRRLMLTRSVLWATGITLGLVSIYGYVDLLHPEAFPRIPLLVIPVAFIFIMTAAKLLVFRQHRVISDEPTA